MLFNFKWERITKADVERLATLCNLTSTERQILELRRKGIAYDVIAHEVGYSVTQMYHHSNKLLAKILKEV
jgi:DNA-binding NarL/FixJ family response regulator